MMVPAIGNANGSVQSTWSTAGGDEGNTYASPVSIPINLTATHVPIEKGSAPIVSSNERLYSITRSGEHKLVAMDLNNNTVKWEYGFGDVKVNEGSLAIKDGIIFLSTDSQIYAVEDQGTTASVKWTYAQSGGRMAFDGSSVFFTNGTQVIGLDRGKGTLKWTYKLWEHESVAGQLTTGGGRLYFTTTNPMTMIARLIAVDGNTGIVQWSADVGHYGNASAGTAVFKDGKLYLDREILASNVRDHVIISYDAATGKVLWKYKLDGTYTLLRRLGILGVNNDSIFAMTQTNEQGYLTAINKDTGALRWKIPYADTFSRAGRRVVTSSRSPVLVTADKLFIENNGKIKIFSSVTGELLREYIPGSGGIQLVAVANNMIITTDGSRLFAHAPAAPGSDTTSPVSTLFMDQTTKRFSAQESGVASPQVKFYLDEDAYVEMMLMSESGQTMRHFNYGLTNKGWVDKMWDGRDAQGKPIPYGNYYYAFRLKDLAGNEGYSANKSQVITVGDLNGTVKVTANLRRGPGTEHGILTVLPAGQKVTILREVTGWYEIHTWVDVQQYQAYVSKTLVSTYSDSNNTTNPPVVTPPAPNYGKYTVQSGDTLGKIALNFSTTTDNLITINNLSNPNMLFVGQVLNVPAAAVAPTPPPPAPVVPTTEHVVQSGDTLSKIALKYGVTTDELAKANNISNPKMLFIGQRLIIPTKAPAPQQVIHTVVSGDTLWLISQKYSVPMDQIVKNNNLANANSLFIGQKLIIK